MPSRIPSARPRGGAPFGNTNALKHGFYSRRFRKSEMDDLEGTSFTGLRDEIAVLRVCIRRIIEWGASIQTFSDAMTFLRVVSLATGSLSRLVRTQQAIGGSDLESEIIQAITEVGHEMGIYDTPEGNKSGPTWSSFLKKALLPPTDE